MVFTLPVENFQNLPTELAERQELQAKRGCGGLFEARIYICRNSWRAPFERLHSGLADVTAPPYGTLDETELRERKRESLVGGRCTRAKQPDSPRA